MSAISYGWLEKHLPEMECEKCGECCGPVPCTDIEYAAIVDYVFKHGIKPHQYGDGVTCPWFDLKAGCLVYPVRPYACRLFGHVPELKCAKGHDRKLTGCKAKTLNEKYRRLLGAPVRLLQEVIKKSPDVTKK